MTARSSTGSFADFSDAARSSAGALAATRRRAASFAAALATCLERYHQRAQLAALDQHMLRDIGITRAQARREAGKPFWK